MDGDSGPMEPSTLFYNEPIVALFENSLNEKYSTI
jgi:hypothetical protein